MPSQLQIDQTGLPPGTPGRSRTDGKADGSLVTLTNTGEGSTTAFRLLWTPPGDVDAVGSLAATLDPKVWTFSPTANRYGTYEVELIENQGLTSEKRERRVIVMRTKWLGLVIPALNERGDKSGSLAEIGDDEIVDNNAEDDPDATLATLGYAGWWRQQHALITAVDALFAPVRVTHYHSNAGGAVVRKPYDSLGAALGANYPSSIPSTAVYDIQPNPFTPLDDGPYTLDTVVSYVLRAVGGRGSVSLPELVIPTTVTIEGCRLSFPVSSGAALALRECDVAAALEAAQLEAVDTTINDTIAVTITGDTSTFDRCKVLGPLTSSFDNGVDAGSLTLTNCTFGATPEIEFTGPVAGVVRMDSRTAYLCNAAGGVVTNGSITVEAPP